MAYTKIERDTLPGEIWVNIPFTNGDYSVSNIGRVYSNRYSRFPGIYTNHYGYLYTNIYSKNYSIHRLVAHAFLGFDLFGKRDVEINHIDGNKENNSPSNLEIITHRENIRHAIEHGLKPFGEDNRTVNNIGELSNRLRYYVTNVLKIYPSDFIRRTGAHHSILSGRMKSIKDETLKKIISVYPLNPEWIRYGIGDMLNK